MTSATPSTISPQFLSGHDIALVIGTALSKCESADFAVAFWGVGATARLNLNKLSSARIICDANSGACNPSELRTLLDLGFEIKTISGLHAKVYLAPTQVIIGSANASTNGLGDEGPAVFNEEAAVSSADAHLIGKVRVWFEELWIKKSIPVTHADLQKIKIAWERKQASRIPQQAEKPAAQDSSTEAPDIEATTEVERTPLHERQVVQEPLDARCQFLLRQFKINNIDQMPRDRANQLLREEFDVMHADLAWVTRALSSKGLVYTAKQAPNLVQLTDKGRRYLTSIS